MGLQKTLQWILMSIYAKNICKSVRAKQKIPFILLNILILKFFANNPLALNPSSPNNTL